MLRFLQHSQEVPPTNPRSDPRSNSDTVLSVSIPSAQLFSNGCSCRLRCRICRPARLGYAQKDPPWYEQEASRLLLHDVLNLCTLDVDVFIRSHGKLAGDGLDALGVLSKLDCIFFAQDASQREVGLAIGYAPAGDCFFECHFGEYIVAPVALGNDSLGQVVGKVFEACRWQG